MFKLLYNCADFIFYQVMLKIFQARLQQYMNRELPEFKLDLEDRETIDQIGNIWCIIEKAKGVLKSMCFCFIDYAKAWVYGTQQTVENSERDRNTRPSYLPPEKPVCGSRNNS